MCFGWMWRDVFWMGVDRCVLGGCGWMYLVWVLMDVFGVQWLYNHHKRVCTES